MDDVAREMGISKKTLYLHVSDKSDLVNKTMKNHLQRERAAIKEICQQSNNAIEEMFEIGKHVTVHLRSLNTSIVYDLQKYYPQTWRIFMEYKISFVYSVIFQNIKKGINDGLYREEVNPDIIAKFYTSRSEMLVNQEIFPFPEYTVMKVYEEYLKYHIRGIATAKGLRYLQKQKLD